MMKPTVIHSAKLSKLLKQKVDAGLLKHTRKLTFWHGMLEGSDSSWTEDMDFISDLLGRINDKHGLPCSFTCAAVQKSTKRHWVFVFDCDEAGALALIQDKCKKGELPYKVRVRMVVDRLEKVTSDGSYPRFDRSILTPNGFQAYLERCWETNHYLKKPHVPWSAKGIQEILSRDDFTVDVLEDAWNLWEVKGVMAA